MKQIIYGTALCCNADMVRKLDRAVVCSAPVGSCVLEESMILSACCDIDDPRNHDM